MIPQDIQDSLELDLSARKQVFSHTIPHPWPNRFCNVPKRPPFGKVYDLERERLERLAMAMRHLERASISEHCLDRRAHWAMSIVFFQSAAEGMKVVWEFSPWQAVRHDIAHQLRLRKVSEMAGGGSSFKQFGLPPLSDASPGDFPDELPMTVKKATPMFNFRDGPSPSTINDLGWHIREVRAISALSLMGSNESKFVEWEHLMAEITARLWSDWTVEEGARFLQHPPSGVRPWAPSSIAPVRLPLNFETAWEGFLSLLNTDDRLIKDWLIDEWLIWSNAQVRYYDWRRSRLVRLWNSTCRAHCRKFRWYRSVPMCEALQLSLEECAETAASGSDTPQTVRDFMQPYLPKSTPYL